jgi:hypothetical protein
MIRISASLAGALLTIAASAQDFSADIVNGMDGKVSQGKFYHTANKDRYDTSISLPAMGWEPARVSWECGPYGMIHVLSAIVCREVKELPLLNTRLKLYFLTPQLFPDRRECFCPLVCYISIRV